MAFDWSAALDAVLSPRLLEGAWTTVWLSVLCMALGFVGAVLVAAMRESPLRPISLLAQCYIWVFRGTPVLVQLILIYTGLPQLGIRLDVVTSAIVGLTLNEAAYQAEILRGGIRAMPRGQFEAARALGMTDATMMRRIIAPQTLRLVLLPLGNNFNALIKATSLASVISMEELLRRTELMGQFTFKVLETFTVAALYYLLMTTLWGLVQSRLERRLNRHVLPEVTAAPRLAVADRG
ncbi:amino acid ABC transporter permease [Pseudonocardia sp. DSM 110487]|uniref:amino acid ABC transporter permease n=1 Tax=Pseudonocardia sp. DSM 110487 TaxID=2865833 RepID=UPI001C6A8466|nr:amino acid ABC transporter permease [Pseudonocardia sp. DSM 110487]QYN33939.1 amino acid ABC transporter permease [Pseudonocardia sp. DSM 110487]